MKHLKKLAALLLVGVLALSLLTACGGGGGSTSADAQAETAVMAAINEKRSDKQHQLQNNPRPLRNGQAGPECCYQVGEFQFFFYIRTPY